MLRRIYKFSINSKSSVYFRSCLCYSKKARKPKTPKEDPIEINRKRALKSFDDLYKKIYVDAWPSMRVALLSPSKTALLVNNFSDVAEVTNGLEDKGIISISNCFEKRQREYEEGYVKIDTDSTSDNISEEENSVSQEDGDKYFRELSEQKQRERDENLETHLMKKMHDDPTINVPLDETLATAKFDQSRIIEPEVSGAAVSAALTEFVPPAEIMGKDPDWILTTEQFLDYERSSNVIVDLEFEEELHFPPGLHIHSYERGNVEEYPNSTVDRSGTIDFQEIELMSLLPVLALGVEPKDKVLDMCTQTIDYGLLMLQTLYPESVRFNIHSTVLRVDIQRAMKVNFKGSEHVQWTVSKELPAKVYGEFNKILLCVPNLDDRNCLHGLHTYFNPMLSRERLLLPDEQTDHLINAIKLVQPGGTVLYSTSTLSPLQNEGVVRSAIGKLRYEHGIEVKVKDLTKALRPLDVFFKFAPRHQVGLGHLAVPFLPLNCGPCYVCKIVRVPNGDDPDDVNQLDG